MPTSIVMAQIQKIYNDSTRCFGVVRVDGTEIDYSYHKCLEEKVAKEYLDLHSHYESFYKGYESELAHRRKTGTYDQFFNIEPDIFCLIV